MWKVVAVFGTAAIVGGAVIAATALMHQTVQTQQHTQKEIVSALHRTVLFHTARQTRETVAAGGRLEDITPTQDLPHLVNDRILPSYYPTTNSQRNFDIQISNPGEYPQVQVSRRVKQGRRSAPGDDGGELTGGANPGVMRRDVRITNIPLHRFIATGLHEIEMGEEEKQKALDEIYRPGFKTEE